MQAPSQKDRERELLPVKCTGTRAYYRNIFFICCLPAALTGAFGVHLFTQWTALAGGTIARHAHLPSLSASALSTNAAGVTARQDALNPCQSTA